MNILQGLKKITMVETKKIQRSFKKIIKIKTNKAIYYWEKKKRSTWIIYISQVNKSGSLG